MAPPRKIGFWICAALVVGNMVGSGIYLLPSALASYGGISLVGWILTALGATLLALVFARLARRNPAAGGPYAYTRTSFGDFAGFLIAWGYWISLWCGNAAIAVAFVGYLAVFVPVVGSSPALGAMTAAAALWLLTLVNVWGVREAGIVQLVTTVLKLAPLVVIGTLGLLWLEPANFSPFNVSGTSNLSAVTATAALTLWAFLGLESATIPADEVEDPARTISRATIFGTVATAALYIASTIAVMGAVPMASLAASAAPFADAASALFGTTAGAVVAAGAAISAFGALNGWILLQGQLPLAVARDRLFPEVFAKVGSRGTPAVGLVISSALATALLAANYTRGLVGLFQFVILLGTLTTLIPYAFSTMAELSILMGERKQTPVRKHTVPLLVTVLAFAYSMLAIAGAGAETVYWGFLLLLAGLPVYVSMSKSAAKPVGKDEA